MPDNANSELFAFEAVADARIKTVSIAAVPDRAIWAHYHFLIFYLINVAGAANPASRRSGETTTYRLTYLLPWFAQRSTANATLPAADADAMFRASDPGAKGAASLDAYAHLCEVLPEVRRGRLTAKKIKKGFRLESQAPRCGRRSDRCAPCERAVSISDCRSSLLRCTGGVAPRLRSCAGDAAAHPAGP